MSNIFKYLIFLILLNNCTLDTKSRIWTDKREVITEKSNETKIFIEKKPLNKEFNAELKVKLTSELTNNSFANNSSNNNGRVNFDGKLKKRSKFKFSKIKNFDFYEPELIFELDNLIFFNNKGAIIKFD